MVASARGWASLFQTAALDPHRWLEVLQHLADATHSARAELVGAGASPTHSFSWVTSVDDAMMQDFLSSGGHSADTNFRIAADDGHSVLTISDERDFDRVRRGLANEDFVDFCEQHDMVFGCQTVLLREPGAMVGMSVLRARSEGRTDEASQQTFAHAATAAAAAVRLQQSIEAQGHHLLAGTFDLMSTACVLLDGFARVAYVNAAAEPFFGPERSLTLRDGKISARHPQLAGQIDRALAAMLGPAGKSQQRLVVSANGRVEALIEMFRLEPREWSLHFAPRALLVLRTPGKLPDRAAEMLAETFGLTGAEAEVVALLCQGVRREEILVRRGTSAETLRSQLRTIYSKMGCNRETEAVLLARDVLA